MKDDQGDKQIALTIPEWVKDIKNNEIAGAIVGLLFSWAWDGEEKEIPNLKKYVTDVYDDMSEDELAEVCDLLIKYCKELAEENKE